MSKKNTHVVPFRRKRKGLTNYKKRLTLLLANKPRLVVRKSTRNISAQIINFDKAGDKVIISASSQNLSKFGWKGTAGNLPGAYLVGLLAGKKAQEKGIKEAILDIGLQKSIPGSKVYAVLKGVLDSGLTVPHSESMLPKEDRIKGEHITKYAQELKKDDAKYKKSFSEYIKNNVDPSDITKYFEETKNKILGA